jgi:hypothetical protein
MKNKRDIQKVKGIKRIKLTSYVELLLKNSSGE